MRLNDNERVAVVKALREARDLLAHRIEIQKSQMRRGLAGAKEEKLRLDLEHAVLDEAIRKLWTGAN